MKNQDFEQLYIESLEELRHFMKITGARPNTKTWNKYAIKNGYLLGETIGYISGKGFNLLCREIIKNKN